MSGRRLRDLTREYWFEVLIVVMAVAGIAELIIGRDYPGAPTRSLWVSVPAVAILVSPLFLRRRFPFAGPATYFILAAALSLLDPLLVPFIGSLGVVGLAAAFSLGNLRNGVHAAVGLGLVVGSLLFLVAAIPGEQTASQLTFIPLRFVVAWVAGFFLRATAAQAEAAETRATVAERERDAAARVAVAEERSRIARELHDIVAHAVSVMVLQVGAVRHKLPAELDEDSDALKGVERTGRTALSEMRQLLAAMRPDGDEAELGPQPGLDRLDALIEDVSRAGLPVELHVDGDPVDLPRGIDLSAYRIVQEGLTNALKHAHASDADVTVRYGAREFAIEIRDNGHGASRSDGLGHGLVGIRERVKIYGGEITVGNADGGGFVLSTRFPIDNNSS